MKFKMKLKMKIVKSCAAALAAVSILSTGLVASAAENSITTYENTAPESYDDSAWSFPAPLTDPTMYDQYLSAVMDVCFRNDSQAFVALGLGTAEEATALYNAELDVDSLLGAEYPETLKEDLRLLMAQLMGSARYAVTGCEPQADGSYQVTIIYEQFQVFQPLMEVYTGAISDLVSTWVMNSASLPSDEEMMIPIMTALCDSLRVCLDNATYAEPAIATISIQQQNGVYVPDMDEFGNLIYLMFDTNSLLEMIDAQDLFD